jgi:hypothetical protein
MSSRQKSRIKNIKDSTHLLYRATAIGDHQPAASLNANKVKLNGRDRKNATSQQYHGEKNEDISHFCTGRLTSGTHQPAASLNINKVKLNRMYRKSLLPRNIGVKKIEDSTCFLYREADIGDPSTRIIPQH